MNGLQITNRLRLPVIRVIWSLLAILGGVLFFLIAYNSYKFFYPPRVINFRIAEDKNWFANNLHDKASSVFAFSNQLLGAIAVEEGIQISLYAPNIRNLQTSLEEGEYDAILTAVTPLQKNLDNYLFSDPIYLLGPVLIVREETNIDDLPAMDGKIVGIVSGSFLSFNVAKYPSLILQKYESPQEALISLDRDLIDGVLLDFLPAYIYTKGVYKGKLKVVTPPLNDASLRLVTRKTASGRELLKYFNEGLREVQSNGTYDKLINKWELYPQIF